MTTTTARPGGLPPLPPGQQSNSDALRQHKKRTNSHVTASSVAGAYLHGTERSSKSIRQDCATSVSDGHGHGSAGHSGKGRRSGSVSDAMGGGGQRSSVTSSVPTENNYNDLGSKRKNHRGALTTVNNQQYRQHFTGHHGGTGGISAAAAVNMHQQDVMKRRMSFFKSVVAAGGSNTRRGSAFSTKSQETAVNLTGINPADNSEEGEGEGEKEEEARGVEAEYDEDENMDLDDKDDNEDGFGNDEYNDFNIYNDGVREEKRYGKAMGTEQDYYATHDSMLTTDVELELFRCRQERAAAHQAAKKLRQLRRLRRQSLLSDKNNNLVFGNKAGRGGLFGSTVCPPPLLECVQRPSPIQLPEILHLIFQCVVDLTPPEDYSQRELYNCLLVSKQWYLVAQKVLWREVRFKNPLKLSMFVDLLKRTDPVECLEIEKSNGHQQRQQQQPTQVMTVNTMYDSYNSDVQLQHQLQLRRGSTQHHNQSTSIMEPTVMQKRLHDRALGVKKIVLHKLKLVEDQDIIPLISWFHNLQTLEFYICEKLTDSIVVAVAENCPQLQQLLMPGCAKVTDVGITQVALHCPRMKHLDLRACSNVSDESLLLVAKHCPNLWHLNVGRVSSSNKVTGKSIVEIAKNTSLNTLGLAGCAMTDDAVIEIARYSRAGLHRISLNSCSMLTSASIRALMQLCPNLAVLEIKQCLLVTDMATLYRISSRRMLVELCPQLQKRLFEYKVQLAAMNASMNASIQSNNIALTQAQGVTSTTGNNPHSNNNNNNVNSSSNLAGQNTTQTVYTTHAHNNATHPQQTTTTVISHP
ncbi:Antagonist of MEN (Mitotic Exit Network) [Mortierella claussenii]|nr:Antagonist of MEN (Mitotic Exit Network) [Mortierella claussenii]